MARERSNLAPSWLTRAPFISTPFSSRDETREPKQGVINRCPWTGRLLAPTARKSKSPILREHVVFMAALLKVSCNAWLRDGLIRRSVTLVRLSWSSITVPGTLGVERVLLRPYEP